MTQTILDEPRSLSISFPQVTNVSMSSALQEIQRNWTNEYNDFTNGDCHTLAVSLYQAMGYQGTLHACLHDSFDEDGLLFSTGYSHMVYQCSDDNESWDIGGGNADIRWEEYMSLSTEPDEDGLVHSLRWVQVPHQTYQIWLQEHYGCIDNVLTDKLTQYLRKLLDTEVPIYTSMNEMGM